VSGRWKKRMNEREDEEKKLMEEESS